MKIKVKDSFGKYKSYSFIQFIKILEKYEKRGINLTIDKWEMK